MNVYGTMWDSASGNYPPGAALSAFYYNGQFAHRPVLYRPGSVWIDVLGNAPHAASWLDVETGDASPSDVPGWLDSRAMPGSQGVYCNRDTLPAVERAANGRAHNLWLATLDGNFAPALPATTGLVVAIQVLPASMLGFNADMSVIVNRDYWNQHKAMS